jgi:hypothetical protein
MSLKLNWDKLGVATSLICAIHCALLPALATTLPVFGINIIHNAFFEWSMIALAFVVGSYSLYHGYIKHHHSFIPALIFAVGFLFLVLKQFVPVMEYLFLGTAVCAIISAHLYNYKLCRESKCASPHHTH